MNPVKAASLASVVACVLWCGVAIGAPKPADHANLQGAWQARTESRNGVTKNVTYEYVFHGDDVTFTDENGKAVTYTYALDTASTPRLMRIKPEGAPADSAPVAVAYALDGDSLTIVVAASGLRPAELSDRNDQELIVCTRKRP